MLESREDAALLFFFSDVRHQIGIDLRLLICKSVNEYGVAELIDETRYAVTVKVYGLACCV
jgi:hypothetical protein